MRIAIVSTFLGCTFVFLLPSARSQELPSAPDKLVELLASPNEPQSEFYHPGEPRREMPVTDRRIRQAEEALERLGTAAFPALIAHRSDSRYSQSYVPPSASLVAREGEKMWSNKTVGDVCVEIIANHLNAGEQYKCCHYYVPECVSPERLPQWWSARSSKSLAQLQRESLKWTIAKEKLDADKPEYYFGNEARNRAKQLEAVFRSKYLERKLDSNSQQPQGPPKADQLR